MDKVTDRRPRGWFWLNNELVDLFMPIIGTNAAAVYVVLARHANAAGQCFPGYQRLQRLTKISSPNTLKAAIQTLVKHGLISLNNGLTDTGKRTVYVYTLLPLEEVKEKLSSPSNIDGVARQILTDSPSNIDGALKETQVKEFSSSEEEESAPAESHVAESRVNFYRVFVDEWRAAFPGRDDPEIGGRYAKALKLRGQDLGAERFTATLRAYFASQHYQAVQGGHNVKTFLDWPAETWTQGKPPRPPAARPAAGGTLFEQEAEMRAMREAQENTDADTI